MFKQRILSAMLCRIVVVFACFIFIASCRQDRADDASANGNKGLLKVAVANYPLAYFVERIGGTEVEVIYRIPGDEDPAFWEPTADDITSIQGADLILMNGAGYSKWAEKATLPATKVVDTSAHFTDKLIEAKNATSHSHGKQGEHSHDGVAFTTWIDFNQALQQADRINEALQKLRPAQIELFALNFDLLKQDLQTLDSAMKDMGQELAGMPLTASHPVYQYLARRYHINIEPVLWEPDVIPSDEQMADLKKLLSERPSKWFVWEGEPVVESIAKLNALGLSSVVFDPCGNKPPSGNWLTVMKSNLMNLQRVRTHD